MRNLEQKYNQWCKKTKRNGGIITGESLREFFVYCESIPVPSVEGYLEGKVDNNVLHLKNGGITNYLTITEALTALRALKEDCDNAALVSKHEQADSSFPPEDEMIVTIEVMRMNESGMKYIHISDVGKIKPGKYKLTKIG